ncbi:hypothetical protein QBC37DRAFT_435100 [Rhypophila decipiens]|uniref:Uncharacterized protein n=1 Tax=Rhypophila decipiens TaxID=261697 RepID=A0AAN6XT04_9PEZI|nr:hypothetical protein QBC37DRAFT_435100 [Rhypophila decipiens]
MTRTATTIILSVIAFLASQTIAREEGICSVVTNRCFINGVAYHCSQEEGNQCSEEGYCYKGYLQGPHGNQTPWIVCS